MTSHIGHCTINAMEQYFGQLSQNLFSHIPNAIKMVKRTILGAKLNMPSFNSMFSKIKVIASKKFKYQQNIYENAFHRINGISEVPRYKHSALLCLNTANNIRLSTHTFQRTFATSSVRFRNKCEGELITKCKHFGIRAMITNINNKLSKFGANQQNIFQKAFRPVYGFSGALGHKDSTTPCFYTSSNIRHGIHTFLRSFVTSNVHFHNIEGDFLKRRNYFENRTITTNSNLSKNFAANCDFPIIPIPTKSKLLRPVKKGVKPITQNYMSFSTITDTRTSSEKVYSKLCNTRKSLVTDLMYSFPFNTHSDVHKTDQPTSPKPDFGKMQEKSLNVIIDKLASTPRNSIWSIGDNFSFPSISRRFNIETFVKQVEDTVGGEPEENSTSDLLHANI